MAALARAESAEKVQDISKATKPTSDLSDYEKASVPEVDTPVLTSAGGLLVQTIAGADGADKVVEWSHKEQARVVRKADLFLLPIFILLFFVMSLDRANLSGALTSTILKDVGISQNDANNGVSLLWAMIVVLEIPSNILLQRVGPTIWIPAQVVAWGCVEVGQAFIKNRAQFYAVRILLGLCESGFLPGALFVLSQYYTRSELSKRLVLFFIGNIVSGMVASFIAAGSIKLAGHNGWAGWTWLFLLSGIVTIAAGLFGLVSLPNSARKTGVPITAFRPWLNEREADVFIARLTRDDPEKDLGNRRHWIGFADVKATLLDWRLWIHALMGLSGLQSFNPALGIWGPSIIKCTFAALGFSGYDANLLNVPGNFISIFTSLSLAAYADRYAARGRAIIFSAVWLIATLGALYGIPFAQNAGSSSWSFYVAYLFCQAFPQFQPINIAWVALNQQNPRRRSIALAFYMGASNLGTVFGGQIFRQDDAPRYRRAWAAELSLACVFFAFSVLQLWQYTRSNRRVLGNFRYAL